MKGVILAGGKGTRLSPLTKTTSKQLLPVYDKPLIYYPLSTLMLAGIREILIITTPQDQEAFISLLQDGSQFGIEIRYSIQESPNGLADGIRIAKSFIGASSFAYILGDNIFYGVGLGRELMKFQEVRGAQIFGYPVSNPSDYGVVEVNARGQIISIEEKPSEALSNIAITGLYFYDNSAIELVKNLQPSSRGELEITDLNRPFKVNVLWLVEIVFVLKDGFIDNQVIPKD